MIRIATFGLVAVSATSLAADSVQLKPGRWLETMVPKSIVVAGKPLDIANSTSTIKIVCLSAAEGAEPRLYFAAIKDKDRCVAPTGGVANGKIALASRCSNGDKIKPIAAELDVQGTYGGENYAVTAKMSTLVDGKAAVMTMDATGHFEGPCRGDEEKHNESAR